MLCRTEQALLRAALYDTAVTLFGVFELHDASPELRRDVADALDGVVREHLWPSGSDGPLPLYDLRTELALAKRAGDEEDDE